MANNGAYGSGPKVKNLAKGKDPNEEYDFSMDGAKKAFGTGLSYLSWGASQVKAKANEAGITDKAMAAASAMKAKSDEVGLTGVAVQAKRNIRSTA